MKSITRVAEADWKGNLEQGHGLVTTGSDSLREHPVSFTKRIEQGDRTSTNPEELIAAALASCFSMALSKTLGDEGASDPQLVVRAEVTLNLTDEGPKVNELLLDVAAIIANFSQEKLEHAVATTRKNCPVFKLMDPGLEKVNIEVHLRN
jgi:lipoyl-dependent peroxiredoxin